MMWSDVFLIGQSNRLLFDIPNQLRYVVRTACNPEPDIEFRKLIFEIWHETLWPFRAPNGSICGNSYNAFAMQHVRHDIFGVASMTRQEKELGLCGFSLSTSQVEKRRIVLSKYSD